ncbi:MAG: murein transglycosylase [Rhodobacteraceae bacterium]|nr:murein transglycosylase [Paracoccaceae bacterium]
MKSAVLSLAASSISTAALAQDVVTPDTYIRSETDLAFAQFQANAGSDVNRFFYIRKPTPLDAQDVVRMNRDTLYAEAVVDTDGGARITIPDFPDDRYFSILVVDNDHYAPVVFYEPGTYDIPGDTKYVSLLMRIQIMDPDDPADVALVNDMQNAFVIDASSHDLFPEPQWDVESMLGLRADYEQEFQHFAQYEPDWMGPRGEVNEDTRHLAVAGAWGLFPEKDAVYINYTGPSSADACYTATYEVPPNDAFWSITVYGADGFMKSDANIVNDRNVALNDDGTFTVHYGSAALCGDQPNRVDITEGWNFLMRIYRPGEAVLERTYALPEVEALPG